MEAMLVRHPTLARIVNLVSLFAMALTVVNHGKLAPRELDELAARERRRFLF
jgi:hypothetical protein